MSKAKSHFQNLFGAARMRLALMLAIATIGLLTMLVIIPAPQAQAQTITTLVSNTGQTEKNPAILVNNANSTKRAQAFTTGTNNAGYTLDSIGVAFGLIAESNPQDKLTVTLNEISSGDPGDALCTLVHPASYTSSGVNRYAAPATCPTLAKSTTYFVVIDRTDTTGNDIRVSRTGNDAEDSGGADGWTIAHSRESYGTSWVNSASEALRIDVEGSINPVPPLLVSNTGQGGDDNVDWSDDRAQRFTTGSNSNGYTLSSVEIISEDTQGDDAAVAVWTVDSDGFPDSLHASLTAPANTALAASTTYTVLIQTPGDQSLVLDTTMQDGEDAGGAPGWTIANRYQFKDLLNAWTNTADGESLRIAVKGTIVPVTDTTAPTLDDASVTPTGTLLTLDFNEDIDQDNLPPASAFAVTADGSIVTVGAVSAGAGATFQLRSLSPVITEGQTVVITYTDPTTGDDTSAIQDAAGNDVATFTTGQAGVPAVDNNSAVDVTSPVLQSAAVSGSSLSLVYNEDLRTGSVPAPSAFAVTVQAASRNVTNVAVSSSPATAVILTLASAVSTGDAVTVSYTVPANNPIQDTTGNDAVSFTTGQGGVPAVVNNLVASAPSEPRNLMAARGDRSVKLTWLPPLDDGGSTIQRYQYHRKTTGNYGNWMNIPDSAPGGENANKYTVTANLSNGTRYTFQVRAVNTVPLFSDPSNEASAIPAPVGPPTRPRSVSTGEGRGRIILQWAAPEDDGNSPITSYEFRQRFPDGSDDWETIPGGGEARSHTITGLNNGVFHGFYLRARNAEGHNPQVNAAGTPYLGAPGAPPNFTVETYSGRQIKISWTQPTAGSNVTITGYYLIRSEEGVTATHGGSELAPELTEVILGTSHKPVTRCYRIRTFFELSNGDRSTSAYSPEECASTTGEADTIPLIVAVSPAWGTEGEDSTIDFTVYMTRVADTRVRVRYFTEDTTAKAGQHYQFKSGTVTFSPGQTAKTVPVTLIDDLVDDPYKTFAMRIHNVTGATADISVALGLGSITNTETYPLAGFLLTDVDTQTELATLTHDENASVTLDDPSGGSFAIRAVAPPDAEIGSVRLELTGAKTASRTLNAEPWSLFGNDGDALLGESLPAGAYTLTATVYSEADLVGDLVQTLSVSFTVAATEGDNNPATGLPTISGTAQTGETLTADTSGIADADGMDDAAFGYQWVSNDGSADADIQDATASSYTLVANDAGKTIKVTVSFTDNAGNAETLTSAATAAVAAVAPDAPEHLNVSPHDAQGLDVSWEAPPSDGGSPITGYKVQWREAADSWETPADVSEETVTGTTYTINGLTDGSEYTVRVLASNEAGDGDPSSEKTGTPRETTPPELSTATVDGATLTLTYARPSTGTPNRRPTPSPLW